MPRSRGASKGRSQSAARSLSHPPSDFAAQLRRTNLTPAQYLSRAKTAARKTGYPKSAGLTFSDDGIHKLQIWNSDGRLKRFGRVGYGDFILWTHAERQGSVRSGYAAQKRHVFRASHGAISEQRGITDKYAPNNLAMNILW